MTPQSHEKLGIIAGGGQLPALLIDACRTQGRPYSVLALNGNADADAIIDAAAHWMSLSDAASGFEKLRQVGVKEVVMAGRVHRPLLNELKPDWRTAKFLARIGTRAFLDRNGVGDDRILRAVIKEFEIEGFAVIAVEEVLSNLLVSAGVLGAHAPSIDLQSDITMGFKAAKELGARDQGQAIVVQNGRVLSEETADGTDALIIMAGQLKSSGPAPVLIKVSKPGQDRRADLPAIGPNTVTVCEQAGIGGIVIEADSTLVIDKTEVVRRADSAGVFVTALHGDAESA